MLISLILCLKWLCVVRVTYVDAALQYIRVCPYRWELIGDECFYFSEATDTKNISEAAAHCESFKPAVSLFTPYNAASITIIKQHFLNKYLSEAPSDGLVHLGITGTINTTTGKEEWYWGSGEPITSYWCPTQPDRDGRHQPVLGMRKNSNDGVCFHDTGEITLRPYICHQDVSARCPKGYEFFNGRCFVAHQTPLKFDEAETECNKQPGGHLASIRSTDLLEFLREHFSWITQDWLWVGLSERQHKGTWMFTDGTALNDSLTVFQNGGRFENCAMLRYGSALDDHGCQQELGFICMASAQVTFSAKDVTTDIDIDINKLLDHNINTCIDSDEVLMNRKHYLLNLMTSPTPDGVTISVTLNRNVSGSTRRVLFTWVNGTDCKTLRSCGLMAGHDVTSTSCLYRCPCDEKDKCHVILLDQKKRYKQEPAHICDVIYYI